MLSYILKGICQWHCFNVKEKQSQLEVKYLPLIINFYKIISDKILGQTAKQIFQRQNTASVSLS